MPTRIVNGAWNCGGLPAKIVLMGLPKSGLVTLLSCCVFWSYRQDTPLVEQVEDVHHEGDTACASHAERVGCLQVHLALERRARHEPVDGLNA